MRRIEVKMDLADVDPNGVFENQTLGSAGNFNLNGIGVVNSEWVSPDGFAKKIGLNSLRLYTSGQNLYFHSASSYRGINPEGRSTSGPYASALVAGYQRGAFPIPRTIIFGIDINF